MLITWCFLIGAIQQLLPVVRWKATTTKDGDNANDAGEKQEHNGIVHTRDCNTTTTSISTISLGNIVLGANNEDDNDDDVLLDWFSIIYLMDWSSKKISLHFSVSEANFETTVNHDYKKLFFFIRFPATRRVEIKHKEPSSSNFLSTGPNQYLT